MASLKRIQEEGLLLLLVMMMMMIMLINEPFIILFNFSGTILIIVYETAKHHHQKQPLWDKETLRDVNCQILIKKSVKYENYHEKYYFVQLYTTLHHFSLLTPLNNATYMYLGSDVSSGKVLGNS